MAGEFYRHLLAARSKQDSPFAWSDLHNPTNILVTNDYGIGLPHHPRNPPITGHTPTLHAAIRKHTSVTEPTEFEQNANRHGNPNVTGLSGMGCLLTYFSLDLAERDPLFNPNHAFLGFLTYLVFDGGHSVNEVMAVYHAITAISDPEERVRAWSNSPSTITTL